MTDHLSTGWRGDWRTLSAEDMLARANMLDAYYRGLPDGVISEAAAEAELIRMELRGRQRARVAEREYPPPALDHAAQIAREMIDEWDYDLDPHGYCHTRPMLITLVDSAEKLGRAAYVAEHLFQMITDEDWRMTGGDDGQGHYEGEARAEQLLTEIRGWVRFTAGIGMRTRSMIEDVTSKLGGDPDVMELALREDMSYNEAARRLGRPQR